jgi:hypothetical protein
VDAGLGGGRAGARQADVVMVIVSQVNEVMGNDRRSIREG